MCVCVCVCLPPLCLLQLFLYFFVYLPEPFFFFHLQTDGISLGHTLFLLEDHSSLFFLLSLSLSALLRTLLSFAFPFLPCFFRLLERLALYHTTIIATNLLLTLRCTEYCRYLLLASTTYKFASEICLVRANCTE